MMMVLTRVAHVCNIAIFKLYLSYIDGVEPMPLHLVTNCISDTQIMRCRHSAAGDTQVT